MASKTEIEVAMTRALDNIRTADESLTFAKRNLSMKDPGMAVKFMMRAIEDINAGALKIQDEILEQRNYTVSVDTDLYRAWCRVKRDNINNITKENLRDVLDEVESDAENT